MATTLSAPSNETGSFGNRTLPRHRSILRVAKRSLDLCIAGCCLVVFTPIMLAVAIVIKWQDRGPVLHRRRVVGAGGSEFDAFKFRSMIVDADQYLDRHPELRSEFGRNFKLKSDPRITAFGRWLRVTSVDELPQLINVLRGEMSIVGPRMITAKELEKYGKLADLLLTVRPGITGYWQVKGRQRTSYKERVQMDEYYITHWSLTFDLKILVKTVPAVLLRRGAM
jgi:lipopolysaccharide/colanic/teichoic acid biosynthesis glycosyltransferase